MKEHILNKTEKSHHFNKKHRQVEINPKDKQKAVFGQAEDFPCS